MHHKLFDYFERELRALKEDGKSLARAKPDLAKILDFDLGVDEDPLVRRLVDSFAFLCARLQLKLEDDFSLVSSTMLEVLLPLWLRPIPAQGVVQFQIDDQLAGKPGGELIPRGPALDFPDQSSVRFATCYDANCCALEVVSSRFTRVISNTLHRHATKARAMVEISVSSVGQLPVSNVIGQTLRFYIQPEDLQFELHEMLLNPDNVSGIAAVWKGAEALELPLEILQSVGYGSPESEHWILPNELTMPAEYQSILELFAFPKKFMFFDIVVPESLRNCSVPKFDLCILLNKTSDRLEASVNDRTFRLNCAPVVNLFPQKGVTVPVDRYSVDTMLNANQSDTDFEIFTVQHASGLHEGTRKSQVLSPFFAASHFLPGGELTRYYFPSRRPRIADHGTDFFFSLVDSRLDPFVENELEHVQFDLLCCNRRFLEAKGVTSEIRHLRVMGEGLTTRAVRVSDSWTRMYSPPAREESLWKLVSILNLNHVYLQPEFATHALKEMLSVLDPVKSLSTTRWIESITQVSVEPIVDRVDSRPWSGIAGGNRISIWLNTSTLPDRGSYFLFGNVIDVLLGMHTSLNSFTKLLIFSSENNLKLVEFEKRCGSRRLT